MITNADAYRIYARAWNCLDPEGLVELLAEDVVLSSQKWDGDIRGKEKAEEYIRVKMDTLRIPCGLNRDTGCMPNWLKHNLIPWHLIRLNHAWFCRKVTRRNSC